MAGVPEGAASDALAAGVPPPAEPDPRDEAPTLVDPHAKAAPLVAPDPRKDPRGSERPSAHVEKALRSSGAVPSAARSGGHASVAPTPDPSTRGSSAGTSLVTAGDTLRAQEIAQTRTFVRIIVVFAIVVALALQVLHGDPIAKRIFYGGLAAAVVSSLWLGFIIRDDQGYTDGRALICGFACILCAFTGIYFFGVFSPAPAIIPFGLCFFSTGGNKRGTLAVYLTCTLVEAALSIAILAHAIPDRGLVRGDGLDAVQHLVILLIVEFVFAATYVISRSARASTLQAIEMHDRAVRGIAQREALLKEARQDLAQALKAGGSVGRYTDTTIGAFRLGHIIGRGAMGEVYEASHVQTGEEAAVKVLIDRVLDSPEHVQRFFREARIAASLTVPNVVRVLAVADIDAPTPYIAMERLHGEDLADHLRKHRRLSPAKVVHLVREVGQGLAAARQAGVVHRDLKPRNVFLSKVRARDGATRETWKILDFGVSKLMTEEATLTRNRLVGTPNYMAPEQVSAGTITHKTDIFALGLIAYRALTGRPAFVGDAESQLLYAVVHGMPPAPSSIAPLPVEVDAVMAIALAKSPADRFDDGDALARAIEGAARGILAPELAAQSKRVLTRTPWGA